ncbi:MAG: hypothetical protein PGN34_03510 [Methylobacterium frigidaeris]
MSETYDPTSAPVAVLYEHVRAKLIRHGVENSEDGRLVLTDKRLFLRFVGLERAVRDGSFDAIRARVDNIERYANTIEHRQVTFFAYMYLSLSYLAPRRYHLSMNNSNGTIRKCLDYDREVSDEERLIGDWARILYHKFSKHYFRAIYKGSSR